MSQAADLIVQYARYHRDRRNILTHFVGVPMIVFATALLLSHPYFLIGGAQLSPAWLVYAVCTAWYLSRGLLSLGLATSLVMGLLVGAAQQAAQGMASWLAWGSITLAAGWVIQFVGHYYEGRKPAFVDDLRQLLVGPMFLTAEGLFALGWNPPLAAEVERRAGPTLLRDLAHPA
jgi:uncharacterized membrane protein YGL010W